MAVWVLNKTKIEQEQTPFKTINKFKIGRMSCTGFSKQHVLSRCPGGLLGFKCISYSCNKYKMLDNPCAIVTYLTHLSVPEVIGHLETQEGQDLGEVVIANKSKPRRKYPIRKKGRFQCEICLKRFLHHGRYIIHK